MSLQFHELGDVALQCGVTLPKTRLGFETYGELNPARTNAILVPTWYAGQHSDARWLIGNDRALDPRKFFIVVVNILGNGVSSSPSNQPAPFDRVRFPVVSILDNVLVQDRLLRERFGVKHLRLVFGRSMGAQIAFQWASWFSDRVKALLALAGSARTAIHNYVFLQSVKMSLTSGADWARGEYDAIPVDTLSRMWLIFDSWGLSQAFYRHRTYEKLGFKTVGDFLAREKPVRDPNDLLAQVSTWERADISTNGRFNGNLSEALGAIRARSIVMPSRTDLYFPPEDSELEVERMPSAELRVLESEWGHRAGAPGSDPADIDFIDRALRDLLEQ